MLKALKVRQDNLWYIMQYGKDLNMNLADIKDDFEVATEDGFDIYVLTDGSLEHNNVTFTTTYASTFFDYWKFTQKEEPYQFVEIEKI